VPTPSEVTPTRAGSSSLHAAHAFFAERRRFRPSPFRRSRRLDIFADGAAFIRRRFSQSSASRVKECRDRNSSSDKAAAAFRHAHILLRRPMTAHPPADALRLQLSAHMQQRC
jgi:hypothetical protein